MRKWIVLVVNALILSLVSVPFAEFAITLSSEPNKTVLVLEGSNATLVWQYDLGGVFDNLFFRFLGDGPSVDVIDKYNLNADAIISDAYKGRILENITTSYTAITILGVNRSDSGKYEFNLVTGPPPDRDNVKRLTTIQVQYPPEFTSISDDVVLVEGEGDPSVALECTADGEPTPNVSWTRVYANESDSGVLATGNQFVLENNRNNSGTYRCTAYNGIGTAPNRTLKVDINFKPENVKLLLNDSIVCEGDAISITCSAGGKPAAHTYQLYENGIPVVDGNSSAGVWMRKYLQEGDFSYRCLANKTVGTTEKTVNITVKVPSKIYPFENITVIEGDNRTLTCNASGSMLTVTWTEVSTGSQSNGIIRDLTNISRNDAGEYKCEAVNDCGTSSASTFLSVLYKPENFKFTLSKSTVCQGSVVIFNCSADGNPAVDTYHLFENDTPVSDGSNSLGTWSTIMSTGGVFNYKCVANNSVGTAQSMSLTVTVNDKPENVQLINSAMDNKACKGEVITFNCSADAKPAVTSYQLYKNDTVMYASLSGMWRETLESGGVFVYKCVANNTVGSIYSADVMFTVNVPPSMQPVNNQKVIEGDNVTLMCKVSGMPPPMVSWMKPNGQRQSGYMLELVTISRNEAGEYKCEASNECGNVTEMATIDVQYAPTITNSSGGQTVNKGHVVSLFCTAEGNPAPTITWTKVDDDNSSVNFPLIIRGSQDEGLYRCTAKNGVGSAVTRNVSITVNRNPCLEECTNGRNCREFGKYLCLCPKGKTGPNCKENDTMAVVIMISLKINNKTWREELTDLSDLDTQGFVGEIVDSVDEEFKGSGVREINVTRLREGSVIADISLTFGEPVGESEVESFLQDAVNDGGLGTLKVDTFVVGPTLPDLVTVPGPVPSEPTKVNKDVIYGSVIGVLGLILAVIALFTVWKHRQRERDDRLNAGTRKSRTLKINEGFELESINGNLNTVAHHGPGHYMDLNEVRSRNGPATDPPRSYLEINEYAPLHPGTRSWEVERENVTIEKVIGKGAFGQVAQGKASNLRGREETITVAIKMLKGNARDLERKDLLSELEIMKKLKPHPHVIKLLGCVTISDPLLVLIEYVPYGDLRGYLRKSRHLEDNYFNDPDIKPQTSLASQQLMKFSWQVADGMHYLSSKSIIHRDLAARNVLVGERERCKVTDFGMARDVCQENIYERKSKGRLPVKWTASEALLYGRYTTKSDVWSFGIVLYEIFTIGGSPYPKIDGRKIAHLLSQGYRMPKPRHVDDTLYKIMQDCWQENPDDRPVFESLRNDLKEMESQHQRLINMQLYDNILYASVE